MNQSQRIEKINQYLNENIAAAASATGRVATGLAKNPFLQQILISLGIDAVSSVLSGEKPDKPFIRSASVSLQQPGSDVTPVRGGSSESGSDGKRTFAKLRGKQVYPGRM